MLSGEIAKEEGTNKNSNHRNNYAYNCLEANSTVPAV